MTCANKQEANKISKKLLDEKLAACVRLTDVKSNFWWHGKQESDDETLLIIESVQEKFDNIEVAVKELHSYDTFVLTSYATDKVSAGVEDWVRESLT